VKLIWRTLQELLPFLPGRARHFFLTYTVTTSALALLDIAALMLLAVSLTAMIQGDPVMIPGLGTFGPESYVWILLVISLLVLLKSTLALILQWIATRKFARYELEVGDQLFDAYIKSPWTERLKRNSSQLVRLADVGIANVTAGFLLPVAGLPTLMTTSFSVLLVLVIAQPMTALVTVVYLGLIAAIMYFWMARRSIQAGRVNRDYSFRVVSLMTDMVSALKEITLRDMSREVADVVHNTRIHTTRARANLSFLGVFPRFVLDGALIGGFLLVGGFAYLFGGASGAISAIALFGVAGFRLVPSLTSFQAVINQATSNTIHVVNVLDEIRAAQDYLERAETIGHEKLIEEPRNLSLKGVSFTYPGSSQAALSGINLELPMGTTLGLVGASGSGKSTLVDLILGLLAPSSGSVMIGGQRLEDVMTDWRLRVGYVPQDVALFDGSVAQNVALMWRGEVDHERVENALRRAQLWDVVAARPDGISAMVGDRGLSFSGGQRQRLGIARALYADPLILILDEATSALDTKTESDVTSAIHSLRGKVTVVSVAHRLSTIRDYDQVCFMNEGRIVATGTFDEVVEVVPEFRLQANLAGLAAPR
jgi:ABC-type multidrug transport system fused ATPase/permease subunit